MVRNGIHHVTAIAGDPRRNLDFYTRTLGLRLVKKTVNFDDPGSYHLYYGDAAGTPGTILTFFPWAQAAAGRNGVGELQETMFRIPRAAIGYWTVRLMAHGVERTERFGEPMLTFRDPDGMRLALVGVPGIDAEPAWDSGEVPAEHAVRGFHGVSLLLDDAARTGAILSGVFGFEAAEQDGNTARFRVEGAALGGIIDLRTVGGFLPARLGRGSVHHLAFRAADDAAQAGLVAALARDHGIQTTEQKDRDYFRSVYFREPGGVLFEIATDIPGFAVDEDAAALGRALKLPRFCSPTGPRSRPSCPPWRNADFLSEDVGVDTTFELVLRHRFVRGADPASPPLLLHGTGGNEDDLMPLGRQIAPGAALLAPPGAVTKNGMPRFFRRLAEGVFDEADLRHRTAELADFITGARDQYGIGAPVAVGFCNGANIAAALLMLNPGLLAGAVLLQAMVPFRQPPAAMLPGTSALLLSGLADLIVPAANVAGLAAQLEQSGADVTHRLLATGHGLSQMDIEAATAWLKEQRLQ